MPTYMMRMSIHVDVEMRAVEVIVVVRDGRGALGVMQRNRDIVT